jgi:uncharacterized protein YhaN
VKLIRAEIDGFGKLEQQAYDFSEGLQMVFGGNESGKSTLYCFLEQMLFGFETAKKENRHFRPKNKEAVFGGRLFLELPKHGKVTIERFGIKGKEKARKNNETKITLVDGRNLSEEEFFQLVRPLNLNLFRSVYSLKQEQLSDIRALSVERIEETLLSIASTGSRELIKKAKLLQEKTSKFFAKKGSARPLNASVTEILEIRKKIFQKEREESSYQAMQQQLLKLEEDIKENRGKFQQKFSLIERLTSQMRAKESFYEWKNLQEGLQKNPLLPEEDDKQLVDFYYQYSQVKEELAQANRRYQVALTTELSNRTENYSFYLREKDKILNLLNEEARVVELTQKEQEQQVLLTSAVETIIELSSRWKWHEMDPPCMLDYQETQILQEKFLRLKFENESLLDKEGVNERKYSLKSDGWLLIFPVLSVCVGRWLWKVFLSPWNLVSLVGIVFSGIFLMLFVGWSRKKYIKRIQRRRLEDNRQGMMEIRQHFSQLIKRANLKEMSQMEEFLRFGHQVEDFRRALNVRDQKEAVLEDIREQLGIFDEKTLFLQEWIPFANQHVKDKFQAIRDFLSEMESISEENRSQNSSVIFQRIQELEVQISALKEEGDSWIEKYHLIDFAGMEAFLDKQRQAKESQIRLKFVSEQLKELFDLEKKTNFEKILQDLQEEEKNLQILQDEYQRLLKESASLKGRKSLLEADGTLLEWVQNEGYQRGKFQNLVREWLIDQVETKLLIDLLRYSSDQTLHELLASASRLLASLTSDAYIGIEWSSEKLQIEGKDGQLFRVVDLSTGTRDQLYLSIRMAFLFRQNKYFAPILMDDVWLHYDEKRKGNFVKLLKEVAKESQVLLFSSDERMRVFFAEEAPDRMICL